MLIRGLLADSEELVTLDLGIRSLHPTLRVKTTEINLNIYIYIFFFFLSNYWVLIVFFFLNQA